MSTTVSHPIPTAQAQAIADLTGYEDAATLRWQQACVQAANAAVVVAAVEHLQSVGLTVPDAAVAEGCEQVQGTMNGYGKIYGVEFHNNALVELDPIKNTTRLLPIPTRDDKRLMTPFTRQENIPATPRSSFPA